MINIIDLIIGVLALIYLLKNAGGLFKTVKNFIFISIFVMIFGLVVQLLLNSPLASPAYKVVSDSYTMRIAKTLVNFVYPPIRNSAPKVDEFISKEMIENKAVPTAELPKIILPKDAFPRLSIPEVTIDKSILDIKK